MITLTETLIDLADRHTTLYHFGAQNPPLPLGNPDDYCALHKTLATQPTAYADLHHGAAGVILRKLAPAYRNHKYWSRYLSSKNYKSYPALAWEKLLPIQADLSVHIDCEFSTKLPFTVRPIPRVLLYPFGWSAWISLKVMGPHKIGELSSFIQRVVTEKAFTMGNGSMTLSDLFNQIAEGVRADAFGEDKTKDVESSNFFVVTTVMAKHGGSPALGGLSFEEETQLLRFIRPDGPLSGRPFKEHVFQFPPADDFEFVLFDDVTRFNWMEHLLVPEKRNHQLLHCYHNNSFMSMIQADHFLALLDLVSQQKTLSAQLFDVLQHAKQPLKSPGFRNASLRAFLTRSDVVEVLKSVDKLKPAGDNPQTPQPN